MSNFAFRGFIIFVMVLLLCGIALSEELQLPIQAHRVAIDIANRVSGFDKLPNFSEIAITVQKIVVTEDDTELYQWIEGRSFWKVSYSGVVLETDGERNPYINTFDVLVDVETGQVPKIASQWMPGVDLKYRKLEAESVAYIRDFMVRLHDQKSRELYKVPERSPQISFLESLKTFLGYGYVDYGGRHEKRIVAVYRWDAAVRDEKDVTVPVWHLTGFGGKNFAFSAPAEPTVHVAPPTDDTRVQKHLTIDAERGEVLSFGGSMGFE
jgi:hypothetical protein